MLFRINFVFSKYDRYADEEEEEEDAPVEADSDAAAPLARAEQAAQSADTAGQRAGPVAAQPAQPRAEGGAAPSQSEAASSEAAWPVEEQGIDVAAAQPVASTSGRGRASSMMKNDVSFRHGVY